MNILDEYRTCKCHACIDLRWWELFMEDKVIKEFPSLFNPWFGDEGY